MITRIAGRLDGVDGLVAEIGLTSGLAYQVLIPGFLAERLAERVGGEVSLATLEYLEPVGGGTSFVPRLVGFETAEQRRFLELLTTCKGMGTRKALRSLVVEPAEVAGLIGAGDARGLQKLPEIGKRLAETIIAELHDKVAPFISVEMGERLVEPKRGGSGLTGAWGESVAALVALGQPLVDAERMVLAVRARHPELADADAIVAAAFGRGG